MTHFKMTRYNPISPPWRNKVLELTCLVTGRNFTLTPPPSTRRRRLHVSPKCPCARRMVSWVSPHRRHAAVTAHRSGSLGKRMSKKRKKKRRWRCWRPPPSSSPLPPEARNSSHPHLFADHIKQHLHHPQPPPISDHFDIWRRRRKRLFVFFFLLFFYFWRVIHGFLGCCFSGGWQARACGASGGSIGWCRCVSWSRLLFFCHPDFWNISLLFTFFSFFFFLKVGFISSPWLIPQIQPIIWCRDFMPISSCIPTETTPNVLPLFIVSIFKKGETTSVTQVQTEIY